MDLQLRPDKILCPPPPSTHDSVCFRRALPGAVPGVPGRVGPRGLPGHTGRGHHPGHLPHRLTGSPAKQLADFIFHVDSQAVQIRFKKI